MTTTTIIVERHDAATNTASQATSPQTGNDTANPVKHEPEQVGREYEFTTYGMMSRRVGGDGTWYGRANYKTEAEAMAAMKAATNQSRIQSVGGITVNFGAPGKDIFEYKVTRSQQRAVVLATGYAAV
jgi:hypothetical protein